MLNVLLVILGKEVIHKLKILGKKGWGANFEISVGEAKGGTRFLKNLGGIYVLSVRIYYQKPLCSKIFVP